MTMRHIYRKLNRENNGKSKIAWGLFICVAFFIAIDCSGIFLKLYEKDFETDFHSYPIAVKDFTQLVSKYK